MTELAFKEAWLEEERQAEIRGWDFSHIRDRYREEGDLQIGRASCRERV